MPLEKLYTDPEQPLGLHSNFSIVLRQAHAPTPIDFGYPVVLVSGVPGQLRVPALPFANEEAVAIEQMLRQNGIRVQHLQGSKATRENLDSALTEYPAIVHFATHGLADPELPPETSALLLTADGNDAASCLLTYQDILMMDWSSVILVVLSACNSSVGKVRKGSPMQGLAYAFLSKGVQYVVASRSPVSDRSSKIIMTKFYEYLQSTDPVEAMRLTRAWFHHQPGQVSELDVMAWGVWT
jgi:CHAT domain-containing protein